MLEQQVEVVIYTHPDCEYSAAAREEMNKNDIRYREIDISVVPGAVEDLERLTGGGEVSLSDYQGRKVALFMWASW